MPIKAERPFTLLNFENLSLMSISASSFPYSNNEFAKNRFEKNKIMKKEKLNLSSAVEDSLVISQNLAKACKFKNVLNDVILVKSISKPSGRKIFSIGENLMKLDTAPLERPDDQFIGIIKPSIAIIIKVIM